MIALLASYGSTPIRTTTVQPSRPASTAEKQYTQEDTPPPLRQRYDFWNLALAPLPPNFFGSIRRLSATSNVRSY